MSQWYAGSKYISWYFNVTTIIKDAVIILQNNVSGYGCFFSCHCVYEEICLMYVTMTLSDTSYTVLLGVYVAWYPLPIITLPYSTFLPPSFNGIEDSFSFTLNHWQTSCDMYGGPLGPFRNHFGVRCLELAVSGICSSHTGVLLQPFSSSSLGVSHFRYML